MQPGPATAREAAERNAAAVVAGNFSQVMADITPEALTQMMQMGAAAGGLSPTQMPNISGYELSDAGKTDDGEGERFHVTFVSSVGRATLEATWQQVMGQWKIVGVTLVSAEPAPPAAEG
ncbi:MAG TPA: hypothetical protein VFY90_05395 [Tepidiformaceae bacterium]|nr:hypothetical protein [Tepidiformaceae bacterium]